MIKIYTLLLVCLTTTLFAQKTNGEFLRETVKNYDLVLRTPEVQLNPQPNLQGGMIRDGDAENIGSIVPNKFEYKSRLKKKEIYSRLIKILNSNTDILTTSKVVFDDDDNLIIERRVEMIFFYNYANETYERQSSINLKIKVKDNAYQIEVLSYTIGITDANSPFGRGLREHIFRIIETASNPNGDYYKKLAQQDYNKSYESLIIKFKELSDRVNETNDF